MVCNIFSALLDQLSHLGDEQASLTHAELRDYLCFSLLTTSTLHSKLPDSSVDGVRKYSEKMTQNNEPGDDAMVLTAATALKRRIRVFPLFKARHPVVYFNPVNGAIPKSGDVNLLLLSKDHFVHQAYLSLIKHPDRTSFPTEDTPLESTNVTNSVSLDDVFEEPSIIENQTTKKPTTSRMTLSELRKKKKEDMNF